MAETLLATAIDVQRWLRDDQDTAYGARLHRDRSIGVRQAALSDLDRVLDWWQAVRTDEASNGARVAGVRRIVVLLLILLGLVVGGVVGAVAFSYQGAYPVNLFTLLGVLIGVPGFMLVVTLMLLPGRAPGTATLRGALGGANPARWAGVWLDRLADLQLFAGDGRQGVSATFARWQVLVFSQWLVVGYFTGVMVAAWILIVLTDLAFGWSSTLEIDAGRVHGWVSAAAAPWSGWLSQAVPDRELVEASRFFRLETGGVPQSRAIQLGGWWPFVLMMILCYGLLPRVLLLVVGSWRLRAATRRLLTDDPQVTALLDRLSVPEVNFDREDADPPLEITEPLTGPATVEVDDNTRLIAWNAALEAPQASAWIGATRLPLHHLAVWQSQADIHRILEDCLGGAKRVLIFTKGWEPPLLEFLDFLDLVRAATGAGTSITLLPINVSKNAIEAADREIWARALARRKDPRLYVLQAVAVPS